ncbi:staygreen family protein [Anaeromicrobium sediminis]|uniref:Staygreen protein domain-containing protein n=1 Tax=Anaeromicrobium sediminis TaxID=1478221 RepID=A0A267MMV8_9FIRM|nr:staygreen family protein [Anaeromicrobium sediminis]PAB60258.1 hypothetical protein CCE28_04990 [Anaeromicrobium sediminis]
MSALIQKHLYVNFQQGVTPTAPILNRCYTVTCCEKTCQIYLSVGREYNIQNVRSMRGMLLARWTCIKNRYVLKCCCPLGGGTRAEIKKGYAKCRCDLPLALGAIVYGDRLLLEANPCLCRAPIYVEFTSPYYGPQRWKTVDNWRID